jgi:hypothetical protein
MWKTSDIYFHASIYRHWKIHHTVFQLNACMKFKICTYQSCEAKIRSGDTCQNGANLLFLTCGEQESVKEIISKLVFSEFIFQLLKQLCSFCHIS